MCPIFGMLVATFYSSLPKLLLFKLGPCGVVLCLLRYNLT